MAESAAADLAAALLEGVREGVFLTGPGGEVRSFNPAAEVITGRTSGEVLGERCARALGCAEAGSCALAGALRGKTWTERLCRGTRADGRPEVLRLRMRAIVDGAGRPAGTVAVFSEASLQESLQKKLAAYERLASLGELATIRFATGSAPGCPFGPSLPGACVRRRSSARRRSAAVRRSERPSGPSSGGS